MQRINCKKMEIEDFTLLYEENYYYTGDFLEYYFKSKFEKGDTVDVDGKVGFVNFEFEDLENHYNVIFLRSTLKSNPLDLEYLYTALQSVKTVLIEKVMTEGDYWEICTQEADDVDSQREFYLNAIQNYIRSRQLISTRKVLFEKTNMVQQLKDPWDEFED